MKTCSKCNKTKPVTDYYRNKNNSDGLQYYCKSCMKAYQVKYKQTAQGKASIVKYQQSANGKATHKAARIKHLSTNLVGYLHNRYNLIKHRCNNPITVNYDRYGGMGITCEFSFKEFYDYVVKDLQITNIKELQGLQIHRVQNTGNYTLDNIVFITQVEHAAIHKQLRSIAC